MEMGTGKTKVVLDLIASRPDLRPALIVAPLSILDKWIGEAMLHHPELKGQVIKRGEKLDLSMNFYVINYEMLWRMAKALVRKDYFKLMVLDESVKIKNRTSKQSRGCIALGRLIPNRIIMSGCPVTNNPLDLWNQMNFLNPNILKVNYWAFRDRHAVMEMRGLFRKIVAWKNLEMIDPLVKDNVFRVLKKDCLDLPDKVYEIRRIDLSDHQKQAYKQMKNTLVSELSDGTISSVEVAVARLMKLSEICGGFMYTDEKNHNEPVPYDFKENPKLDALKDLLENVGATQTDSEGLYINPVVVWCRFRREAHMINKMLDENKIFHECLTGDASVSERSRMVDWFQKRMVAVLVSQPQVGGMGLDMTASNICVFYSNDYSFGNRIQAEDRLHRIGQKRSVVYVDLVARGTIDWTVIAALKAKKNLAEMFTDPSSLKGALE
jgi:SNF2 family DNA or RNA helicase